MSGASGSPTRPDAGPDPSMEDILASIRRILNEDEVGAPPRPSEPGAPPKDDVLVLDSSMIVDEPDPAPSASSPQVGAPQAAPPQAAAAQSGPAAGASNLVAPEAAASAASAVSALVNALVAERTAPVHRGGPTIEEVVRDEVRPLLKAWLDQHLPPIVERLVRVEIERVVGRTAQ